MSYSQIKIPVPTDEFRKIANEIIKLKPSEDTHSHYPDIKCMQNIFFDAFDFTELPDNSKMEIISSFLLEQLGLVTYDYDHGYSEKGDRLVIIIQQKDMEQTLTQLKLQELCLKWGLFYIEANEWCYRDPRIRKYLIILEVPSVAIVKIRAAITIPPEMPMYIR